MSIFPQYKSISFPKNPLSNPDDWMGDENEPLKGFSWRSGSDRDTTGIIMWSDVFLHTVPATEEKIAIIVLHTQGLVDNETFTSDNAQFHSLVALISSQHVFNLMNDIQEDQLQ